MSVKAVRAFAKNPQAVVDIGAPGWLNTPDFSPAKACGGIAQLVERLNGIQEVRSSTLLTSTTSESQKTAQTSLFARFFVFAGYGQYEGTLYVQSWKRTRRTRATRAARSGRG